MCKIKICGLTREEDVRAVVHAGADYAGFVVNYPKSRRSLTIERALQLAALLPSRVEGVALFVDEPIESVLSLLARGGIGTVQLHGNESAEYARALKERAPKSRIIKAFVAGERGSGAEEINAYPADLVLIDGGRGEGRKFDYGILSKIERPFLLAGGLTPENLSDVIAAYRPYGVDLSSGVEKEGQKEEKLIMRAVKIAHEEGKL